MLGFTLSFAVIPRLGRHSARVAAFILITATPFIARAETGYDAWLRYDPIQDAAARKQYDKLPTAIDTLGKSEILDAAQRELIRGVASMLGRQLRPQDQPKFPDENCILLGTFDKVKDLLPQGLPSLADDGFCLRTLTHEGRTHLVITAPNERGVLYGVFALLRTIALQQPIAEINVEQQPYAPIRYLNHWDNLDGSIERGYAGRSIFWEGGQVTKDLDRVRDYARLMASVGINGCSINNVNADTRAISPELLPEVATIADVFRPYGVRLILSLDFAAPRKLGGIDTFDPLDPRAVKFWQETIDRIYGAIPDLGGFVLKADSEGRLGPSEYGRTHADAANVIARALAPHNGLLFYRGFVYDHKMDWNDPKNDRARAAYDNFHKLDNKFADNVVIQIKHGPIDFQVREPASPLFAGIPATHKAIELQVTQEYLGQQRHLCFVVPMWKEVLDFDLRADGDEPTPVRQLVAGGRAKLPIGGFVAVSNVGRDTNWLHHQLAMANLYGYGRLAWNPNLTSREAADEWTRLTFGPDPLVVQTITDMLLRSWSIYENYTGPLGVGTLTDIIHVHYGPGVESSERNGWGQWHRADEHGIGMDRTVATGTGFIGQYSPAVAATFESLETCPDELLLFMHHVPYTHVLHNRKTVIQHFYDTHYDGADQAAAFVDQWKTLADRIDDERYKQVLDQLEYQAGHAIVWRDAVCNYFHRLSGIDDTAGRVGNHPHRIEAEEMQLTGYESQDVTPWETASAGRGAALAEPSRHGSITHKFDGQAGRYKIAVVYFDENDGTSNFTLTVAGQELDKWTADRNFADSKPNGHTSTRRTITPVALQPGDEIKVTAAADGGERACVDYVEITPTK